MASPDHYAVFADQTLSVPAPGFLANDVDTNGESIAGTLLLDDVDHGSLSALTSGAFNYTPDPGFTGTDSFEYEMQDASGNPASAVVTIDVLPAANRDPVASDDRFTALAGMTLSIAAPGFLRNDIDPDGDAVSGNVLVDDVDHGSLSALTSGAFNYTPDPGFTGIDSFTYGIIDVNGHTDQAVVTIEVIEGNRPPVAVDDQYAVVAGTALSIAAPGFLSNDVDPDGDAVSGNLLVDDVDHGSLSALTSGAFTYTPDPGFAGIDSFTYGIVDGNGHTDEAVVTIEVVPAGATILVVADSYVVFADQTLSITAPGFLLNDLDPDGLGVTGNVLVDNVDHGTLSALTSGEFSYTPDPGFTGIDSFEYGAVDSDGNTGTAVVIIEVLPAANRAPVAADDYFTALADMTLPIAAPGFLHNDIDPDGDAVSGNVLVDNVDHGSLSALTSGAFTYTPDPGFTGIDSFTYGIVDEHGHTDQAVVTIEVIEGNRPPLALDDHYAVVVGTTLSIAAPGFVANDVDPDGDTVTGSALVDNVDHGSLSALTSGAFNYTPEPGFAGTDYFTYSATDGHGHFDEAVVTLEVVLGYIPIALDIKPGSDPNSINCAVPQEVIAVAILSTEDFDATTVDHETVTFEGASEVHMNRKDGTPRRHEEDVDEDGDTDLLFHFLVGDTGLTCESTEATLMGQDFGGATVIGIDAVRMVGSDAAKTSGTSDVPLEFALHGNYPNPFNPTTSFRFDLPETAAVRLSVYDLVGRRVATAIDRELPAGSHSVPFDASVLPSGVYLYTIEAGEFVASGQMVLVK